MAQAAFVDEITEKQCNLSVLEPSFKQLYCRLCLSITANQYQQLFSPYNTTQNIVEAIQTFARVSIFIDDEYSKLICSNCFTKLTDSQNFKCVIENSDFKLKNRLTVFKKPLETCITDNSCLIKDENGHEKFEVEELDLKKEIVGCYSELLEDNLNNSIESHILYDNEENGRRQVDVAEFIKTENLEEFDLEQSGNESDKEVVKAVESTQKEIKLVLISSSSNNGGQDKVKRKRPLKYYHLKCPHCDRVFKRHEDRKRHLITHTGVYPFYCSFCNKGLTNRGTLKDHEASHTGEKNYQCETCGKSFKQSYGLSSHKKSHVDEKPFKCDQCDKEFKGKHSFMMHKVKHTLNTEETDFICEICNKHYKTKYHLRFHMYNHKERELFPCNVCGKSVPNLSEHLKAHTKPYKCDVCNQGFRKTATLKAHLAVHTGDRLFECDICKKTFRFSGSLYTHKKTHDLTKRLKCDVCDKLFAHKHKWKLHRERMHNLS